MSKWLIMVDKDGLKVRMLKSSVVRYGQVKTFGAHALPKPALNKCFVENSNSVDTVVLCSIEELDKELEDI